LTEIVKKFDTTLKGFRDGVAATNGEGEFVDLAEMQTPKERQIINTAYQIWTPYLARLEPLLRDAKFSPAQLSDVINYARTNNAKLANLMHDLKVDLERIANREKQWLWWIQITGLAVVVLNVFYTRFKVLADLAKYDYALAQGRKEIHQIMETVQEGLFLINPEYRLGSQYSKSVSQILRLDIEPAMRFSSILEKIMPKEICDNALNYIRALFGGEINEAEVDALNPLKQVEVWDAQNDTNLRYLSFNFNPVIDYGCKFSHLLVTVQDVTGLVQLKFWER
jgi:hypothetical protein